VEPVGVLGRMFRRLLGTNCWEVSSLSEPGVTGLGLEAVQKDVGTGFGSGAKPVRYVGVGFAVYAAPS
jgi:hypothetical protein